MAIAYHSGSLGADTANADPAVITLGAISAGEYIIAGVVSDAIATLTSLPSGFSQLGSILDTTADNQSLLVARKTSASGSEGALTFAMTQALIGIAIAFSGVDGTTPEDVAVAGVTDGAATGATGRTISASLTTVTNGCMIVAIAGTDVAASTDVTHAFATTAGTTAGWTIPAGGDIQDGFFNMAVGYALQSTAGAVTVRLTSTWAGGANAGLSLMLVALRPAATGPVLSAPTPSGTLTTETTATIGCTTDDSSGTLYVVVDSAANLSGVTISQVKAGQKASGASALAANSAAVSTSTPSAGVTGLSAGTLYSYAIVQNGSLGDSNLITGTFTTSARVVAQQPGSVRITDGDKAYLQVVFAGAAPLSYQWQDDRGGSFANCSDGTGTTSQSYVTAALATANSGRQYRCVLTDANGSTNSSAATITVIAKTTGSLGQFDPDLRVEAWF